MIAHAQAVDTRRLSPHTRPGYEADTRVATMAQKLLPTAAVNRKVDGCSRFLGCQTRHQMGWMAKNLCVVSWRRRRSSCCHWHKKSTRSTWTTIADCKDKGNALKLHLPKKKTVVFFKTLVLECAWVPNLVHPRIIQSLSTLDVTHVIKCTRLSPSLVGRAWEQG